MIRMSASREIRIVSEEQIFRLYEGRRFREDSSLKPTPIPEYVVQLLVKASEQNMGAERPRTFGVTSQ